MTNKLNLTIISMLLFGFMSCSQYNFEPEAATTKGEKKPSTIFIADLKANYITTPGYFTADKIVADNELVINGIVTSTDIEGNIYKYISIQEEIDGGEAIRVSVDASGISALYPFGQRVSVIVNDLYIGKYGESPQIGVYFVRPKDGRFSPGAIPMPIARNSIIPYGEADPSAVVVDTMNIAEILSSSRSKMDYRLICIKNAYFTGKGYNYGNPANISEAEKIFAPGTNGIGFPQAREIKDGTGSIAIATSEFARFAQKKLPALSYIGDITVIASWYKSKDDDAGGYQLTLRTLGDLGTGFDAYLNNLKYTRQ